jgi:hypothetical protein
LSDAQVPGLSTDRQFATAYNAVLEQAQAFRQLVEQP